MCKNKIYCSNKNSSASLVGLLLLLCIILVMFSGCSSDYTNDKNAYMEEATEHQRFSVEYFNISSHSSAHIITDNETGEQYLFYKFGSQGGLTKLETE